MSLLRFRTIFAFLILGSVLVLAGAIPLAHAQDIGAESNTTNTTTSGASPPPGQTVPASCEEIQQNPTGDSGPYRVVTGHCTLTLDDGDILSRVHFKGNGELVNIRARGSGWTIRNVAVTNANTNDGAVFDLQVNARNGTGLFFNTWVSDTDANAVFVHAKHAGRIVIQNSTFLNVREDGVYASPPGNLHISGGGYNKDPGRGGTVHVVNSYAKNIGRKAGGDEDGYGFRFGSDGSSISNTVVVNADIAIANLFATGTMPNRKSGVVPGLRMNDVSIVNVDTGIRLGSHQDGFQRVIDDPTITRMRGVRIGGSDEPLQRNINPEIIGSYTENPSPTPPAGAPRSPELAASGIGGGTGLIGGAVGGPTGFGGSMFAAALLALAIVFLIPGFILWRALR